jgi:hypothetical protein
MVYSGPIDKRRGRDNRLSTPSDTECIGFDKSAKITERDAARNQMLKDFPFSYRFRKRLRLGTYCDRSQTETGKHSNCNSEYGGEDISKISEFHKSVLHLVLIQNLC